MLTQQLLAAACVMVVVACLEVRRLCKLLKATDKYATNLKQENTQLKLKLIPIEVSQRYDGLPRDIQYDIWYQRLLEEYPGAVDYSDTRLTSTFNYYLDFHGIK